MSGTYTYSSLWTFLFSLPFSLSIYPPTDQVFTSSLDSLILLSIHGSDLSLKMKNSIPSDVWEKKRALIAKLYKDEEWPLKQVIKQIRSDDFNPR